jgi:DNA-binding response OmpR family regulator
VGTRCAAAFDVLLSDLHMPNAGDGFTVVSAMRHTHPEAVTLVFSGYPALDKAMDAILLQADEVLVKPMPIYELVAIIRAKLQTRGTRQLTSIERVVPIPERDSGVTITNCLARVNKDAELTVVPLSPEARTGHLPKLLEELVQRLRAPRSLGTKAVSQAAIMHGRFEKARGIPSRCWLGSLASCRLPSLRLCRTTWLAWTSACDGRDDHRR